MGIEYQRETAALDTVVPLSPTAGALTDILSKAAGARTFDKSTDSLEAVADAIAALSLLSAKEKSLLGIGVFPGFQDFFNTVADGADPSTTYWTVVENVGTVTVENDTTGKPGFVNCAVTAAAGNDAIVLSTDKVVFGLKTGVTTLHLKACVKMNWTGTGNGENGIGFVQNDLAITDIAQLDDAARHVATIVSETGVPTAWTSDGTTAQSTNLSAYISDNTWFTLEIIISATDVKFYIDNTLRATHTTNVPSSVWRIIFGTTSSGGADITYVEYIQAWGE